MLPRRPRLLLTLFAALCALLPLPATAQRAEPPTAEVDRIFTPWNRTDSPGCVVGVGRAGEILLESAYGMADLEHGVPLTPASVLEIGSVSKQFVTAAVLLLAQEGKLALDDDVRRYVPEMPDFGHTITLRQMAQHLSGLRDHWELLSLQGSPPSTAVHTIPQVLDLLSRQQRLNFPPGDQYLYSNMGYIVLGTVVQRVSGRSLAEFSRDRLFHPHQLNSMQWRDDHTRIVERRATAYEPHGNGGWKQLMPWSNVYGSGGLLSTIGDLVRWNELLHNQRIGEPGFSGEMLRVGRLNDGRETSYALGLTVGEYRGVREVSHGGSTAGYRAFLAYYPDERLSVALTCNHSAASSGELARLVAEVFLGSRLSPRQAAAPPPRARLSARELERFAGLYRNPVTEQVIRLQARDGRLVSRAPAMELIPVGRDRFRRSGSTVEYQIQALPGGSVLELRQVDQPDPVQAWVAVPTVTPSRAPLAGYVGSYYSPELDVTYEVVLKGGTLELRRRLMEDRPLQPTFADAFALGGANLIFRRDAEGRVSGFGFYGGRIRDVRFERREG